MVQMAFYLWCKDVCSRCSFLFSFFFFLFLVKCEILASIPFKFWPIMHQYFWFELIHFDHSFFKNIAWPFHSMYGPMYFAIFCLGEIGLFSDFSSLIGFNQKGFSFKEYNNSNKEVHINKHYIIIKCLNNEHLDYQDLTSRTLSSKGCHVQWYDSVKNIFDSTSSLKWGDFHDRMALFTISFLYLSRLL